MMTMLSSGMTDEMSEDMARAFTQLRLSREMCLGLREAIRPLADSAYSARRVAEFCTRLYLAHYSLESDPDLETVDFPIDQDEVMIINNFLSVEDGEWAKDILHQTRQVLYELISGREAVRLASSEDAQRLFEGLSLDPNEEAEPHAAGESDEPEGEVKV